MNDTTDDIAEVVQIDDVAIDRDALYARIREGLARHGAEASIDFPVFDRPRAPELQSDVFSPELVECLAQLNASFDQVWVELSLIERQYPVIGGFVNRFKRDLHQLVMYYVNQLAQRQQTVNEQIVRVMNQMLHDVDVLGLDDMRARLDALEQQVARLSNSHGS